MDTKTIEPKILKGFRDFFPVEAQKRQYVINTFKEVFEIFGFSPLETPTLEYEEILSGKYGEEGDKLMYRFTDQGGRNVAMRYDQTVPLARVVAQYQNELTLPFKRYQIQNVWRSENPQKGRYREFLQCDIDTVGIQSLIADAEILAVATTAFARLGLKTIIKINDRKNLEGILPIHLASVDKLSKIGVEGVTHELEKKGLSQAEAQELISKITNLKTTETINSIMDVCAGMGLAKDCIQFDPVLVRGLDYYTGMITEVVPQEDPNAPSLAGGGRYDDLIGIFAEKQIPAVGLAFGLDRIIEILEERNLFPSTLSTTQALVTVFNDELLKKSLETTSNLRNNRINTEIYLDAKAKMDKQLKYADKKQIPFVIIIGPDEAQKNMVTIKDLKTGEQKTIEFSEAVEFLSHK